MLGPNRTCAGHPRHLSVDSALSDFLSSSPFRPSLGRPHELPEGHATSCHQAMATFGRRILRTSAIPRTVLSPAARVLPRPRPRPAPLAALPTGWAPAWRRSVSYKRFGDGRVVVQSSSPWGRTSGGGASGRWSSNPRLTLVYWAAGLGTVWIVFHLDQVPETGRWRYLDTSEKMELAMGDQVYRQTLDEYRVKLLPPNHPTSRYVAKVAQRIIMASELPRHEDSVGDMGGHEGSGETGGRRKEKIEWKVHVINDPNTLNAFVTPGGKVFVFTGILPVCKNEDGLAAVLAHETAHVIARHVAERMSMGKVAVALAWAIDSLLGTGSLSYSIVSLLVSLPNSRTNEAEGGCSLLALA